MSESVVKRSAHELVEDVYISTLVDVSQSMRAVWPSTVEAYNAFLADRRQDAAVRYSGGLFNTEYLPFVTGRTSHDAGLLDLGFEPDGGTALFDAVLHRIGEIDALELPPSDVLFVVFSDGEDNSSKAGDIDAVRERVMQKRALGWRFIFFAPTERTRAQAYAMGFEPENIVAYAGNSRGVTDAFRRLSKAAQRFIAAAEMGMLPPAKLVDD